MKVLRWQPDFHEPGSVLCDSQNPGGTRFPEPLAHAVQPTPCCILDPRPPPWAAGRAERSVDPDRDFLLPNLDGQTISLGQTWVEGWLGLRGPDTTNTPCLQRSLVGPHLREIRLWLKPISIRVIRVIRGQTTDASGDSGA